MVKGVRKREYHKKERDNVNRTALLIGGAVAAVMLIVMVVSFLAK